MIYDRILELINQGESACLEFKEEQVCPESLAREMVAFANILDGIILIGVADDGTLTGITDPAEIAQRVINIVQHNVNRQATKEELSRLFQAAGLVHFDISPIEGTRIDDFDPARLYDYWQSCYQIPYVDLVINNQNNQE